MKNFLKTMTVIIVVMFTVVLVYGDDTLNISVIGNRIENNILKHEYQIKFTTLEIKDLLLTPEIEERVKSIVEVSGIKEDNPKYKEMYKSQLNLFLKQMSAVYKLLQITSTKEYYTYSYKQLRNNIKEESLPDMQDYMEYLIVDKKNNCYYEISSWAKYVIEHKNSTAEDNEFIDSVLYPERFLERDYLRGKELFSDLHLKIDKKNFPFLSGDYDYFEHKDNLKVKDIFGFDKSNCRLMEIISHLDGTIRSTMKWSNYSNGKKFDYPADYEFIDYDKNNKMHSKQKLSYH